MKDLFKFPKEALIFLQEVAKINEDLLLETTITKLLSNPDLMYSMHTLNEEKSSMLDAARFKRLDLALEFTIKDEVFEFIIFIENQTTNNKTMAFRMIEYITATLVEKIYSQDYDSSRGLPHPIPILIFLSKDNCTMPISTQDYFKTPKISNAGLVFNTLLVDLGGNEYAQILENTSTPSIFLQLMKALYIGDIVSFNTQRHILYKNLSIQTPEIQKHYKSQLGLLAIDFVDFFKSESNLDESEVKIMSTTVRELLNIDEIQSNAAGIAKIEFAIDNYNKFINFEEVRNSLFTQLQQLFITYEIPKQQIQEYLSKLNS